MSGLSSIAVPIESAAGSGEMRGNRLPMLHEIRHGLKRLAATGESTLIDLTAIPFSPDDEARLLGLLGEGEVQAEVDALGPTRVWESAMHGIWIVEHLNQSGQRLTLQIEITVIPEILRTQPQDIEDAILALDTCIAAYSGEPDLQA